MAYPKGPTLKVRLALQDYILNPTTPIKEIAERNKVKYETLRQAIRREREWINEQSMEIWKDKKVMAMRTMEALAERGNYRALEFLLRSNDINPEQRVVSSDQEIHISIENKDEQK